MHLSTESLHPVTHPAMPPVLLTLDGTISDAPPPVASALAPSAAHNPVAEAAALQRIACRSFQVSGAQADVQRVLFGLVPWLSAERCEVESISKGGLTFESRLAMSHGESVELKLRVPGQRAPLLIKGEVRWCKRARYGGHRVGVQFAAYGASAGRNSRSVLVALRALEAKHA